MILVIHAHPYPTRSRAGGALLGAIRGMPRLEVRSLYDLYPDFDIDPESERRALERAHLVVLMHPIFWYTTPAILKHWFDEVLVKGWAYGEGGTALAGKDCLWVTTSGGDDAAYSPEGRHAHPFEAFAPVVEQTMRYCGMRWLEPFALHGANLVSPEALAQVGAGLRARLEAWRTENGDGDA